MKRDDIVIKLSQPTMIKNGVAKLCSSTWGTGRKMNGVAFHNYQINQRLVEIMTKNLKNERDLHRLITYLLDKYLLCNVGQKPVEIFLVLRIDEPIVKHAQRLVAEKFEESFL